MWLCIYDHTKECHNEQTTTCIYCILDKIRAEIEEMYYIDEGLSFDLQISREDVLKIIDKYRK